MFFLYNLGKKKAKYDLKEILNQNVETKHEEFQLNDGSSSTNILKEEATKSEYEQIDELIEKSSRVKEEKKHKQQKEQRDAWLSDCDEV